MDVWQNEAIQAASIIVAVVILETLWQLPVKYHPLTIIRLLAQRLQKKVNHPSRGRSQNLIAGSLGVCALVLPLLIILSISLQFVYFEWFFEGLILYIAVSSVDTKRQYARVYKHLKNQNKILARESLSSLVLRQPQQLTPLGCAKAAMESITLRFYYQYTSVIFWFFIGGPIAALFVRLINDFHTEWHNQLPQFKTFGKPVAKFNTLLQWLPCLLHSFIFSLLYRPFKTLGHWFKYTGTSTRDLIIACTANSMQCELGGPAMYNGIKVRFNRHCQSVEIKLGHMMQLRSYLRVLSVTVVVVYVLIAMAIYKTSI